MTAENNFISISDLSLSYEDKTILKDINVSINSGDFIALIGESGAGKSTLLRCMNGLVKPDSGTVIIDNKSSYKEIAKSSSMIFQHFNILSQKTALENVMLSLEIKGIHGKEKYELAEDALEKVKILDKKDQYISSLSGGQKQRVAIARALATQNKILLCDEPTSALDPESTTDILKILKNINKKFGITIIIVTHEIQIAQHFCNYIYVMKNGKIIEHNNTEEIFLYPKEKFTQKLVESSFNVKIPDSSKKFTEGNSMVKLIFKDNNAKESIISNYSIEHNVKINIISGYIDYIGDIMFGTLLVLLPKDKEKSALKYFEKNNVVASIIK